MAEINHIYVTKHKLTYSFSKVLGMLSLSKTIQISGYRCIFSKNEK